MPIHPGTKRNKPIWCVSLYLAPERSAERTETTSLTQNQLTELFESDQAKALVERAEERGFIEPAELEAFAVEHELNDEEAEAFTRELETHGLEVRQAGTHV